MNQRLDPSTMPPPPAGWEPVDEPVARGPEALPPPPPGWEMVDEPAAPQQAGTDADGPGDFSRGFVTGLIKQNPSLTADTLEALSHQAPERIRDVLLSGADELRDVAKLSPEEYATRSEGLWEIEGIDDALTWAGEGLGQVVSSTLPPLALGAGGAAAGGRIAGRPGAIAGGVAGAFAGSYALNTGEVYRALLDEGVEPKKASDYALVTGGAMAALDQVFPTSLIKRLGGLDKVRNEVARRIGRRVAAEAAKGATREGLTEVAQEALKEAAVAATTEKDFFTAETGKKLVEAGALGAMGGGVMGAPTGLAPDRVAGQEPPPPEAEAAPPPAEDLPPPPPGWEPVVEPPAGAQEAQEGAIAPPAPGTAPMAPRQPRPAPAQPEQPSEPEPQAETASKSRGWADQAAKLRSDDTIRLYRGFGGQMGGTQAGGWFTTDLEKAKRFAGDPETDVAFVDVARKDLKKGIQGHGGPDEWVTDSAEIIASAKPLAHEPGTAPMAPRLPPAPEGFVEVGSRNAPVTPETAEDVAVAAQGVDLDPTDAQVAADNYKMGHARLGPRGNQIDVSIENPKGGIRRGRDPENPWQVTMPAHYGRIKGTVNTDGEPIDVFVGDEPTAEQTFVIAQNDAETGKFDEYKVMVGFPDEETAIDAYEAAFSDERGRDRLGSIEEMSWPALGGWLDEQTQANRKEGSDAEAVRGDQGQPEEEGRPGEEGEDLGGEDIQRQPEGRRAPGDREAQAEAEVEAPEWAEIVAALPVVKGGLRDVDLATRLMTEIAGKRKVAYRDLTDAQKINLMRRVKGGEPEPATAPATPAPEITSETRAAFNAYLGSKRPLKPKAIARQLGITEQGVTRLIAREMSQPHSRIRQVRRGKYREGGKTKFRETVIERMPAFKGPVPLIRFLAMRGGIKEDRGELKARDLDRHFVPGVGRLVRAGGLSLDEAREAAVEAGYLREPGDVTGGPAQSTVQDLLDALDSPQPVYSEHDADEVERIRQELATADQEGQIEQAIDGALDAMGMARADWSTAQLEAATRMVGEGIEPMDAFERIAIEIADAPLSTEGAAVAKAEDNDEIPWYDGDPDEAQRPTASGPGERPDEGGVKGGERERPSGTAAPEQAAPRPGEAGVEGAAGEPAGEGTTLPTETVEVDFEGPKEQTIVPGSEKASEARLAQRRADARLKPAVEQKFGGAEGGLFGPPVQEQRDLLGPAKDKPTRLASSAIERAANPVFYSGLLRAVEAMQQPKGSPQQWSAMIQKAPGIKREELEWTGLLEWLGEQTGSVTREQVAGFVRANQIQVRDVTKGSAPTISRDKALEAVRRREKVWFDRWQDVATVTDPLSETEILAAPHGARFILGGAPPTKFGSYTLPGGENYREMLLTLPERPTGSILDAAKAAAERAGDRWADLGPNVRQRYENDVRRQVEAEAGNFRGGHFDEPNVVAHVRFNERTDTDGKRVLFIEELQSDWGAKLRKSVDKAIVPDAPFVKSTEAWAGLIFKRTLRYAVDSGSRAWHEVSKPETVRENITQLLGRELVSAGPLEGVDSVVLLGRQHEQVRRAIVEALPVDVVNILADQGFSADQFTREYDVVANAIPVDRRAAVAIGLQQAAASVGARTRTVLRRVLSSTEAARRDDEILPALRASHLNAREIVRLLAPSRLDSSYQMGRDVSLSGARSAEAGAELSVPTRNDAGEGGEPSTAELARLLNRHDAIVARSSVDSTKYEPGFDKLSWTPGSVQADRYDLSKYVDSLKYYPPDDNYPAGNLQAFGKGDGNRLIDRAAAPKDLPDLIGKQAAEKLLATPLQQEGATTREQFLTNRSRKFHYLAGIDLKVGGEGMLGFYDKILPATVNKLVKRWGGRVGTTTIDQPPRSALYPNETTLRGEPITVHSLDITPEMRESVRGGQPLFRIEDQPGRDPVKLDPGERRVLERAIAAIIRRVAGRSPRIFFADAVPLDDAIDADQIAELRQVAEDAGGELRETAGGMWVRDPVSAETIIAVALQDPHFDPRDTAYHEAFHQVELALLTPAERELLTNDEQLARMRAFIEPQLGDAAAGLPSYEVTAIAFARYAQQGEGHGLSPAVTRIFRKIAQALREIRRLLTRRGHDRFEDIFDAALAGRYAERLPATPGQADVAASAGFQRRSRPPRDNQAGTFEPPSYDWRAQLRDRTGTMLGRIVGAAETFVTMPAINVQDRFLAVKRYQRQIAKAHGQPIPEFADAYLTESLFHGRTSKRLDDLRHDRLEPLIEAIHARDLTLEEADLFLYARHAPERNAHIAEINPDLPDGGSGITDAEAEQIIEDYRAAGKLDGLEAVARQVDGLLAETRQTLLEEGLISQEMFDAWTEQYQSYVPLRGWEADPDAVQDPERPRIGRRFDIRGKEAHAALGRTSHADSPLAYVMMQAQQAIVRGEKNKVAKSFLDLVHNNPHPGVWQVDRRVPMRFVNPQSGMVQEQMTIEDRAENVLAVKVGGVNHYITMHDPNLARAVKGVNGDALGPLIRVLHSMTRWLSYASTSLNPEFVISNFFRDLQTAQINVTQAELEGVHARILKDIPKAMAGVWHGSRGDRTAEWARHYHEFADAGGKTGWIETYDIERNKRELLNALKRLNPSSMQKGVNALAALEKWISDVNMAVENGVRLATFVHARRAGLSSARAASLARELTVNFNRKGEWGAMINAFYLFYNASIQGSVRMFRALRHKKVRRIVAGLTIASLMIDALNRAISDDDDDDQPFYDKIPFWEKERNLILMMPTFAGGDRGAYIKVPLPWGYNVFHTLGQQTGEVIAGVTDPLAAASNVGSAFLNSFNPIGGGETLLNLISPTVTKPVVEIYENKDWLGRPVMPTDFPGQVPTPDSEKYWSTVNPSFKWMAENLNWATGGDDIRGGLVDVSPESIEHWAKFVVGGAGAFAVRTEGAIEKWINGEDIESFEVPFTRRVYGEKSTWADRDIYYQIRDSVLLTERQLKVLSGTGRDAEMKRVMRDRADEMKMIPMVKKADSQLRKLRQARRAIEASQLTDEQKQKQLDAVAEHEERVMLVVRKRFNGLLNARE